MNEVNARRARLQLGWVVTMDPIFGGYTEGYTRPMVYPSGGYTISGCNQPTRSTQPCIPPGSLNRVPASAGVKAGMSALPGGR